jgi:hypothetical protein
MHGSHSLWSLRLGTGDSIGHGYRVAITTGECDRWYRLAGQEHINQIDLEPETAGTRLETKKGLEQEIKHALEAEGGTQ